MRKVSNFVFLVAFSISGLFNPISGDDWDRVGPYAPLSDYSVMFKESHIVAIVEFFQNDYFEVKEVIFPNEDEDFIYEELFSKYKDMWIGIYTKSESDDAKRHSGRPPIIEGIPYIVFFEIRLEQVSINETDNWEDKTKYLYNANQDNYEPLPGGKYNIYGFTRGKHGAIPFINMDNKWDYEEIHEDYYRSLSARPTVKDTPSARGNHCGRTIKIMRNQYGTVDGTLVKDAIINIQNLYSLKNKEDRIQLLFKSENLSNPAFLRIAPDIIQEVVLKKKENIKGHGDVKRSNRSETAQPKQ